MQSIVVGFVVKMQSIVVECLRLDSGLPIITADFAQSLQAPSLCQQSNNQCKNTRDSTIECIHQTTYRFTMKVRIMHNDKVIAFLFERRSSSHTYHFNIGLKTDI